MEGLVKNQSNVHTSRRFSYFHPSYETHHDYIYKHKTHISQRHFLYKITTRVMFLYTIYSLHTQSEETRILSTLTDKYLPQFLEMYTEIIKQRPSIMHHK